MLVPVFAKVYASIQQWAFLREANRNVFQQLMSLEPSLISLYRLSDVLQRVVQLIEQAANYSRGVAGSRLLQSMMRTVDDSTGGHQPIFDENCLDQAEHTGMLAEVSRLSTTFTTQLRNSFLLDGNERGSAALHLVSIYIKRSAADFTRLLSSLRISDLISDATVLDLRRNGQKCLDAAISLDGLLSNFSMKRLFLQNLTTGRGDGVPRGNENIISFLQTMLLAIDANLNKLSVDFARLYEENKMLLREIRALLPYQSSVEHRYR